MNAFAQLGLSEEIVSALNDQGYKNPTPIQSAAIPKALAGTDLLAAAQTGTGKTAAFMLPSLQRMQHYANTSTSPAMHPVRMLVLTPTRELADQIDKNIQTYTKNLSLRHTVLFGGMSMETQKRALQSGCEIVVATVGRLLDHVQQKNIQLNKIEILVLDEADRMLDMGFIDDIRKIMQMLPTERQTLLFSATFAPAIERLAQDFMHMPEEICIAAQNTTSEDIEQHIIAIDAKRKRALLRSLITDLDMNQVIVFCTTKQSVDRITRELNQMNIKAQALHGDKSQQTRLETLSSFKKGKLRVLVATDVAARGLDIAELPFVINYELPANAEDYVHRIGRTGRAGMTGVAISLMDEYDYKMFNSIQTLINSSMAVERIEGFEPRWWQKQHSRDHSLDATTVTIPANPSDRLMQQPQKQNKDKALTQIKNDRNDRQQNKEALYTDRDMSSACQRIPGRKRRTSRNNRPCCALLQPNYGIKNRHNKAPI